MSLLFASCPGGPKETPALQVMQNMTLMTLLQPAHMHCYPHYAGEDKHDVAHINTPDSNLHSVCVGVARAHSKAAKARAAAADCCGTSCCKAQVTSLATVGSRHCLQKVCPAQAGQRLMNPGLCRACLQLLVMWVALQTRSVLCISLMLDACVMYVYMYEAP